MAIKFQYNKTSLQQLEKQLKVRVRTLLHELLQGVVHLAALPFHNVHHAQFPDLCQKCFVLLMIHKERELLHFRNHASASFLFS